DAGKQFQKAIDDALKKVNDLTIPFTLITKSWFKGNSFIFDLKGPGKYTDLAPDSGMSKYNYKARKMKMVGFVYPILKLFGVLESSLTEPGDSNAIAVITNGTTLTLGTKVPYAQYLHTGTKHMPMRPVIIIGAEQSGPIDPNNRQQAWIAQIQDYVLKASANVGTVRST
ncbi:MAG TPA: hypothetical protein VM682_08000, partial [Bacillus sp. (in: firmicutes)]|nr:hypothetical protein [Bacillus sp. (in: firmicutes)]